jgi:EAL domain-containing protein (putative c-di-GMP-specific phosphodiesterase class I)
VASRGVANVSDSESLFHLGGDEFALYVPFLRDEDQLRLTARNLLTVLNRPYHFNTETLHLRFVAGLASCNAEVTSAHSLLQFATTALSRAKRQGVTLQVYSEGMEESSRTHLHMVQDLRKAVSDREFSVHYQPIHVDGEIVGFEALARWEHPSNGNISPAVFIPIAEESGLISEIGQQVLETACRDLSRIRRTTAKDLYVSVNLSVKQLGDFNLVAVIEELLLRYELPPSALRLEVTESSLMVNLEQLLPVLEAIRRLGVVLSVDDFGTGYSSLAYLKRLPISVVKIDRSFIIGIPSDRRDVAIVRSIIAMAEGLGMELVAEGVDRIEQLDCLSQLGCRGVQGFLYSRPKPVDELEADVRVRPVYNPETISRN